MSELLRGHRTVLQTIVAGLDEDGLVAIDRLLRLRQLCDERAASELVRRERDAEINKLECQLAVFVARAKESGPSRL